MPPLPRVGSLVVVGVLLLGGYRVHQAAVRSAPFAFDANRPYRVERVIDGDTLLIEGNMRVRLLGVDTPETKHPHRPVEPLGEEASRFTRAFVADSPVRLEFDRERRDAARRMLAYVFVDDRCLNEELIRAGLSRAETAFPYSESRKRKFRSLEAEAKENRRGLWADTPSNEPRS